MAMGAGALAGTGSSLAFNSAGGLSPNGIGAAGMGNMPGALGGASGALPGTPGLVPQGGGEPIANILNCFCWF